LRDDRAARQVSNGVAGYCYATATTFLRNSSSNKLDKLLRVNAPLTTVYLLKSQLKGLWYAPSEVEACQRCREWYRMAIDSGLKPLFTFAGRLLPLTSMASSPTLAIG